jgi:adenylate cyclase
VLDRSGWRVHAVRKLAPERGGLVPNIYVLPDQRLIECRARETVLSAGLRAGIPFAHACGARASCSTCRVLVVEGRSACTEQTAKERVIAERLGFSPEFRLACQTKVSADLTVRRLVLDDHDVELADIRTGFVRRNVRGITALAFGGVARHRIRPRAIGEEQHVAVLFADIRGFTGFSEALLPYDVIHVLERHLRLATRTVERHGGVVTSFIGDGLMALFRPGPRRSPSQRAVRAGLEMLAETDARRQVLGELYGRSFELNLGVHDGPAIVGTVGGGPSSVTAIGDTVNVASRIEQANKELGTRFLISEATLAELDGDVRIGRRFCCPLPGKAGEHTLIEVLEPAERRAP